jgi:hypothetical protein
MMTAADNLERLRQEAARARDIYQTAARQWLTAQIAAFLQDHLAVEALGVEGEYCYDDEGGSFLTLSGRARVDHDGEQEAEEEDGDAWSELIEGCPIDQATIAELFGLDDNYVGESLREREDLLAEARAAQRTTGAS